MMIVTLIFNIVSLKYCLSFSNPNNLQMIADVIKSYEQPNAVVANVCWTPLHKSKLARILAKEALVTIRYSRENEVSHNKKPDNSLFIIMDANCRTKYFLSQANASEMFSKTFRWLLLGNTNTVMDELGDLSILVDSEFIIAEEQDDGDFILRSVYKIKPNDDWIVEYYGSWTTINGLIKSDARKISNVMRRKDLKGNAITSSAVITHNRTRYDYADLSNTLIDPVTKSALHTLKNLYDFLNATRILIFTETWGYPVNGSWTGMNGDIQTGQAELCGSISFINQERLAILDFMTVPAAMTMAKIVFRQPPLSYQFNLFVLPFTSGVWYCLGGFFVILIIILYIHAKWDIKKYEDYKEEIIDETSLRPTWSDVVLFIISAISQQGSSHELKGNLGRLVMFLVFLAFLFFYTSYSASIVVLLQSTSDQIRTVTDLMNSKLEFGVEDTVYNKYYFSAAFARDPVRKAFFETKIAPRGAKPYFISLEDGVKRVQTKPFAFNMNIGSGYRIVSQYFQEHEKCGLREIDYIQGSKPWCCSKKDSPFNEMFKVGFIRIEEHGLSDRNNRLIFAKKPSCTVTSGNFGSVNMVDFYPVLLMLLYGMILAFALLLLEILIHRRLKMTDLKIQIENFILQT